MYKYTLESYYRDGTGYYLGRGDEQTLTVYAEDDAVAIKKAKTLRPTERRGSKHDTLTVRVVSVEEIMPTPPRPIRRVAMAQMSDEELRQITIDFAWPEIKGQYTYETLPEKSKAHVDTFLSLLHQYLEEREAKENELWSNVLAKFERELEKEKPISTVAITTIEQIRRLYRYERERIITQSPNTQSKEGK